MLLISCVTTYLIVVISMSTRMVMGTPRNQKPSALVDIFRVDRIIIGHILKIVGIDMKVQLYYSLISYIIDCFLFLLIHIYVHTRGLI